MNKQLRAGKKKKQKGKQASRVIRGPGSYQAGRKEQRQGSKREAQRPRARPEADKEEAGRESHGRARAAPGGRSCQETAEQT